MQIENLLAGMTLREKIGQTVILLSNPAAEIERFGSIEVMLEKYPVGGLFVGTEIIKDVMSGGVKEQIRITNLAYQQASPTPLLLASDLENGCGSMIKGLTPFPFPMALGAAGSNKLAYDYGKATALEAQIVGVNWTFSPVADLNTNRFNPITNIRSVSDQPSCAIPILTQLVKGMQQYGLAGTAKHFPGDGTDYRDQHLQTTRNELSMEAWYAQHGAVFQALIDAGVYAVMTGHISLPAYQKQLHLGRFPLPATLSHELTTKLLKDEMGFQGVIVSDALIMGGYLKWFEKQEAYLESFKAGTDMLLWPELEYMDQLEQAILNDEIGIERLDDAVRRILQMKVKLGLFDSTRAEPIIELTQQEQDFVISTAKQVAEQSITLVQDLNNLLPLNPKLIKRTLIIAICPSDSEYVELENLQYEIKKQGSEVVMKRNIWHEELEKIACEFDFILYALMIKSHKPMGPIAFTGSEASSIWSAITSGINKSVVVSFGSPYLFSDYFETAPVYVNAYSNVPITHAAVVKALFGEIAFTGVSPVQNV